MKKTMVIVLALLMTFCVSACGIDGSKALTYSGNLGYDFNGIQYKELVFKVYHSNTENHTWELISEMPCSPLKGHFADIRVDGSNNHLAVVLEDNYYEINNNSQSFFTNDGSKYEYDIEDFNGNMFSYKNFDIEDIAGEQFYRIYPINNEYGTIFNDLDLDKPYDVEDVNIDNLLITITLKK